MSGNRDGYIEGTAAAAAEATPPIDAQGRKVVIRVRDLRRIYRKGDIEVKALDGINLDVHEGEFVSIMGPSGSGKSTLMHLLGGLDQPTSGTYALDGIELSRLDDAELSSIRNRKVGFVFQTFNLLSDSTAAGNIALPLVYGGISKRERLDAAREAADAMGLADRIDHKPTELSGGQIQRVAIARALVNNPRIILADEPTGNLDTQTGAEIMGIFHQLHRQGATIIMVTHDHKLARYADRIIHVRDGDIVEEEIVTERTVPEVETSEVKMLKTSIDFTGRRMGLWDLVRIGMREGLWAHKVRTALTMLGVMFGVAAVIAIVSVAQGAKIKLMRHIEAMGANTVHIEAKKLEGEALVSARAKGSEGLTLRDARSLEEVLGGYIRGCAPMKQVNADIAEGSAVVWATTPEYPGILNFTMAEGDFFTQRDLDESRPVCVLGSGAAVDLLGTGKAVGKQVTIGRTRYDVIGVLAPKPVSEEDFNAHIYVPLSAALRRVKSLPGSAELNRIMLAATESRYVRPIEQIIRRTLRRHHFGVEDFRITIPEEKLQLQQETARLMNGVLIAMAGISLAVGGIGIMNIMLATVTERIREIGVRRAIGATERDILKQFLTEAVGISLAGGILGIVLGWAGGKLISHAAKLAEAAFSYQAAALGFGVAVAVGLIFGIFPAWTAAKQDPIAALRYE